MTNDPEAVEAMARAFEPNAWALIDYWEPFRGTANYDSRAGDMREESLNRATAALTAAKPFFAQARVDAIYKEAWDDLRRYIYDREPDRREKSIERYQLKIAAAIRSLSPAQGEGEKP